MIFDNKVVIVTGASSGIGAATAIKFASEGAKVAMVGRNVTKLKSVAGKCEKAGSKPLVIVAELTNDEDVKRIVTETLSNFGKIDVLVNNAGIVRPCDITDKNAVKCFDEVMSTNLRSVVYLTHLTAPHLVESKGNIVNISSVSSMRVHRTANFPYGASKAALDHFSRCIALDLAGKGVRVNVVNPGPVKTDILENTGNVAVGDTSIWDVMQKTTALDRVSEPEETAEVILFLASDKAKSVTGSCYVTDNGMLLKIPTNFAMPTALMQTS